MSGRTSKISRRAFLQILGGSAAAFGLAACAGQPKTPAASSGAAAAPAATAAATTAPAAPAAAATTAPVAAGGFDWKKYSGTNLRFLGWNDMWSVQMIKKKSEFEQLTGMTLNWEQYPQTPARQKTITEMSSKNSSADLIFPAPSVDGPQWLQKGWIQPLDDYVNNPAGMPADWDFQDFPSAFMKTCTLDGKLIVIPTQVEVSCMMYRKDLLQAAGLSIPKNFTELEAAAKALHKPPSVYGIVNRGTADEAPVPWSNFLYNYGGEYLVAGKSAIDQPPAVDSLDFFCSLHRSYGPPGMASLNWEESVAMIAGGQAAIHIDANTRRSVLEDPKQSKVVGKIGYAMVPAGPKTLSPSSFTIGPAISAFSKNKDAAWLFILWALNKQNQLFTQLQGVAAVRQSAWNDPSYKSHETLSDWPETTLNTMKLSTHSYSPVCVPVLQVRNRVGQLITQGLSGQNVKDLVGPASKDVNTILERSTS